MATTTQKATAGGIMGFGGNAVTTTPVLPYDMGSPTNEEFFMSEGTTQTPVGLTVRGRLAPTSYPTVTVSTTTKIGKRKKQEDRCTVIPRVCQRDDVYFFGVFDGTVGDLAADFVNIDLPQSICGAKIFHEALARAGPVGSRSPFVGTANVDAVGKGAEANETPAAYIRAAVEDGFRNTDEQLIKLCRTRGADYASCTAVTAILAGDVLTVAHLGDSKIVIGREAVAAPPSVIGHTNPGVLAQLGVMTTAQSGQGNGVPGFGSQPTAAVTTTTSSAANSSTPGSPVMTLGMGIASMGLGSGAGALPSSSSANWTSVPLVGRYLTEDHKPDQPHERRRIESNGGSLAYLHGGKPFIRGGDFTARQAKGDRPMQLNYSRAFGGKDLKMFGLLSTPDVTQIVITRADRLLILASDGLWDVVNADTAVRRAAESLASGRDPSLDLVDFALSQHDLKGSIDNVTVTVVVFKH